MCESVASCARSSLADIKRRVELATFDKSDDACHASRDAFAGGLTAGRATTIIQNRTAGITFRQGTIAKTRMKKPPRDPDVADMAPGNATLTVYDEEHIITYLRLLDADAEGADWREVARIVLHIDPNREPARARRAFEIHLARAKWMTECGYRLLLRHTG